MTTERARPRRASLEARGDLRTELFERIARGEATLVEVVRTMRKIAKKTQREYAALVGVAPRVLMDLERGVGNPTLETLGRILAPFGLEVGVRRRSTSTLAAPARYRVRSAEGARLGESDVRREAFAIARLHAKKTGREVNVHDARTEGVTTFAPPRPRGTRR